MLTSQPLLPLTEDEDEVPPRPGRRHLAAHKRQQKITFTIRMDQLQYMDKLATERQGNRSEALRFVLDYFMGQYF